MKYVTKPGKHGTLTLYEVKYHEHIQHPSDPVDQSVFLWAYDSSGAIERFYDSWLDAGWDALSAVPVEAR